MGKKHQSTLDDFKSGAFHGRIAMIFVLQLVAIVTSVLMGAYNVAPIGAVCVVVLAVCLLGWAAVRREWLPVRALAELVAAWDERHGDPEKFNIDRLKPNSDADVASVSHGLHRFAKRVAGFNERERNLTRDASHELRSPLTVIKMSADMLSDETQMSEFGQRSVRRIKRATREMEALVEAFLILARDADSRTDEDFVVNDLLRREVDEVREVYAGRPVDLAIEEPARFSLHASPQAFAVMCWQLIRNAYQQTEDGRIVITVLPGAITVSNKVSDGPVDRHGFELAIAERISERFAWPMELNTRNGSEHVARISFPNPLPA